MTEKEKRAGGNNCLNDRKTQWHMAFTPAMKLEFMEYNQILDYTPGHLLNSDALEIDLLIIKKSDDTCITNEIGRIFRRHNIIEYKSPHDREGVNTYFKVSAYASLYKMGEGKRDYEPEDITITMLRQGKPHKLFKWFVRHGCSVEEMYKGVYYIRNAGFFETQVIVAKELDEINHIWIRSLTDNMGKEQARQLLYQSEKLIGRPEAGYVEAVLQIASKANRRLFYELKKEDEKMYSALVELMQPEIDEAVNKAVSKAVNKTRSELEAQKTVEAIDNIMRKLGMSKTDACTCMNTTPEQYDLYKQLINNIQNTADGKE